MSFFKSVRKAVEATTLLTAALPPSSLSPTNSTNVLGVARSLAATVMTYPQPNNPAILTGDLPDPYYWWEAGAMWGSMLDYYHYTNDSTYNDAIIAALTAKVNTGPDFDFVPPEHAGEEGNDDLAFWGFAVLSAAERNFPQPNTTVPGWLDLGKNIFTSLESRWNSSACGGGLLWQMYASNPNGLNYKNSVANGGFFQLAARLARITGESVYQEWAERVWDWTETLGMIGSDYIVYDGAHASDNCSIINPVSFSYTNGIYLHGAATMANITGSQVWKDRATGILNATAQRFFYPDANATNVMYESACETVMTCNTDMKSFKAYLSRFLWQSTTMLPELRPTVRTMMETTASAATATCTGGTSGNECGMRWYVGGFDGIMGLGQQMSALEAVQGLLIDAAPVPLKGADVQTIRERSWSTESSTTTTTTNSKRNAKRARRVSSSASLRGAGVSIASSARMVGVFVLFAVLGNW